MSLSNFIVFTVDEKKILSPQDASAIGLVESYLKFIIDKLNIFPSDPL